MDVRNFNIDLDLPEINRWLEARKVPLARAEDQPELSYVVIDDGVPVAACSLRRCEGGYGMIDGLVTNPSFSAFKRSDAIDLVVRKVIATAKEHNIKSLLGFSVDVGTLRRSEKHGFRKLPDTVIALNLVSGASAPIGV